MRRANHGLGDMADFRNAISEFHRSSGSWRTVGEALGKSASYAMRVARGDLTPSVDAVTNWHYFTTGQAPKWLEVPACPDCGSAHTGRCHGKPIAAVVVLSEGERVTKAGKARKRKKYLYLRFDPDTEADTFAQLKAQRDAARQAQR